MRKSCFSTEKNKLVNKTACSNCKKYFHETTDEAQNSSYLRNKYVSNKKTVLLFLSVLILFEKEIDKEFF